MPDIGKGRRSLVQSFLRERRVDPRLFVFWIWILTPLLIARLWSQWNFYESSTGVLLPFLRGAVSDGVMAAAWAAIFCWLLEGPKGRRSLPFLCVLVSALAWINGLHIQNHFSNFDLSFLSGLTPAIILSLENLSFWVFIGTSLVLSGVLGWFYSRTRHLPWGAPIRKRWVGGTIAVAIGFSFLPSSLPHPNWLQRNAFEEMISEAVIAGLQSLKDSDLKVNDVGKLMDSSLKADLEASLRSEVTLGKKTNILMLVTSSLTKKSLARMPKLQNRLRGAWVFENFYHHQRQRNRGLYSILCGDYPNLASKESKADLVSSYGVPRSCLPSVLKELGYETQFLQDDPLDQMRIDLFAKVAGFETALGKSSLRTVKEGLDQLSEKGKPWFVTAVARTQGLPALDDALHELEFPKNTLVLLISDDVEKVERRRPALASELSWNRGFLAAWVPGQVGEVIEKESFAQVDLMTSVLDWIGESKDARLGRSIFREYSKPIKMLLANVYTDRVFELTDRLSGIRCDRALENCDRFQSGVLKGDAEEADILRLKQLLSQSDFTTDDLATKTVFEESGTRYYGNTRLVDGLKISGVPGQRMSWEFQIRAGPNPSSVAVEIYVYRVDSEKDGEVKYIRKKVHLGPGQVFDYFRSTRIKKDEPWVWTDIVVQADPDSHVLVEKLRIAKEPQGADRVPGSARREYAKGEILPRPLNLLNRIGQGGCIRSALELNHPIRSGDCKTKDNLLVGPFLKIPSDREIQTQFEIQVSQGKVSFVADLVDWDDKLKNVGPIEVVAGQKKTIEIRYRSIYKLRQLQTRLAIWEQSPDAEFRIKNAQLLVR